MSKEQTDLSYSCRPMEEPYLYHALPERLRMLAEEDPDREAFVFYDYDKNRTVLTRKILLDEATHLAKCLVSKGMEKGDNVGFMMKNSLEMLTSNMAVVLAGGVPFFATSNLSDGSDVINTVRHMNGRFLFIDADENDSNWRLLDNIWPENEISSRECPALKLIVVNGSANSTYHGRTSLNSLRRFKVPETVTLPFVLPEETLVYFCTSGSTGQPKEVTITHYSLFNWTKQANKAFGITNKTRFFNERSFSWIFGYPRTYLTEGATRICVDSRISMSGKHIEFLCDVIEREHCDVIYFPLYLLSDIKGKIHLKNKFKSVKTQIWGGERAKREEMSHLIGFSSRKVCVFYGTTEAGGVSAFVSDNPDEFADGVIGKPLHGVEMKVVDDSGATVPLGQRGEICSRATWRFDRYRKMLDKTASTIDSQGWFHTNDYGHLRSDGNFVLDGRMKEVISTGTFKFFPWDIENTLKNIPGVAYAIAVGVPDKRLGNVVCACVVPKVGHVVTSDDVMKYCNDTFVVDSPVFGTSCKPRFTLVLDKLPLTATGKIDRNSLGVIAKTKLGIV